MVGKTYHQNVTERRVLNYLRTCAVGKKNAKTARQVAEAINNGDRDERRRVTRRTIRSALEKSKMPIGSCNDGYFVIQTEQELRDTVSRLANVRDKVDERIEQVVLSYHAEQV